MAVPVLVDMYLMKRLDVPSCAEIRCPLEASERNPVASNRDKTLCAHSLVRLVGASRLAEYSDGAGRHVQRSGASLED
jgi:hypothetical protein